ncbi:hypothetical protein F4777DRAFT_530534 [Nemania sp. FL0916]|nr:hypothetical protein F4777DRAFT_530534 [Nemania sp. FL0916]
MIVLGRQPALRGANGFVLASGKYCCSLCNGRMTNTQDRIMAHDAQVHPNPFTYLAERGHPVAMCSECEFMCSGKKCFQEREEHRKKFHPEVRSVIAFPDVSHLTNMAGGSKEPER